MRGLRYVKRIGAWIGVVTASLAIAVPAAAAGEGWSIRSIAQPSNFSAKDIRDTSWSFAINATGGTYELQLNGAYTTPIQWNASDEEIQQAVEALSTVGPGNVEVTGGPSGSKPYIVTFVGRLAGRYPGYFYAPNPTNNLTGGTASVEEKAISSGGSLDRYLIVAQNVRASATHMGQAVSITDTLPPNLVAVSVEGRDTSTKQSLSCTASPVAQCIDSQRIWPDDTLVMAVKVAVITSSVESVTNTATIEGGGEGFSKTSSAAPSTPPNIINGPQPQFGIQDFTVSVTGPAGTPDGQAGDHPNLVTTSFDFTSLLDSGRSPEPGVTLTNAEPFRGAEDVKDIVVYLPLGLVGDAAIFGSCPEAKVENGINGCPVGTRLGNQIVNIEGSYVNGIKPIVNIPAETGFPAEFASNIESYAVAMYASVVRVGGQYRLRISLPGVPRIGPNIQGGTVTFFGDPAEHDGVAGVHRAFFRNPTYCSSEPSRARIEVNTWQKPDQWLSTPEESIVYNGVEGCDMLQFNPELTVAPETSETDGPSGYDISVKVPQAPDEFPVVATPDLRNATMTLPSGVSISPSAANGLIGCKASGPEGIDISTGTGPDGERLRADVIGGEGEELGPDGLSHLAPGHCPARSKIGEVEIETPLLAKPLKGSVYVAQPECGNEGQSACERGDESNGRLYGIYLEAAGSGVIIKLKGRIAADPATGQLTATFSENPQLPFDELRLKLKRGPKAPLANPQTCATARAASVLEPWGGPSATRASEFAVTGCTNPMPFHPSFEAGSVRTFGGAFSPFTMTLTRKDGEQDLRGMSITMPRGLEAMISNVPVCDEVDANAGSCSQASRIGVAHVAAGAGSEPLWLEGRVYLTGPYGGGPFGLSIVVPAKAGPFDLGDEVVRAAIFVDEHTGQISIVSNPIPLVRFGVPFRIKALNVTVDRQSFMLNPTNCDGLQVNASISGQLPDGSTGANVPVSAPFAASGCRDLPFKPSLSAATLGHASKANGARLHVVVKSSAGHANIRSVRVVLPKRLPSRLATLNSACPEQQFASNPAGCPAGSIVGTAVAQTPLLSVPMSGPAYFVSHGGSGFPDLVVVLQGDGVKIELTGRTFIAKGVTSSTFASLPDVPVTRFDLTLPQGRHSALAGRHLCRGRLVMPTTITGQNGARVKGNTRIAVAGCGKHRVRPSHHQHLKAHVRSKALAHR